MTNHLEELMHLDQSLLELLNEQYSLNSVDLLMKYNQLNIEEKSLSIINKMTIRERIEALKRCQALWEFIDIKPYLKKYPINKAQLKKDNSYIEEYENLRKFCSVIVDNVSSLNEYQKIVEILQIDEVEDYLLTMMTNEQLYELSSKTDNWNLRLFYYSYIK